MYGFSIFDNIKREFIFDEGKLEEIKVYMGHNGEMIKLCVNSDGNVVVTDVTERYKPCMKVGCG